MLTSTLRERLTAVIGDVQLQAFCDEYGAVFVDGTDDAVPISDRGSLWQTEVTEDDGTTTPIYVQRGEGDHEFLVFMKGEVIRVELESERDRRVKRLSKSAQGGKSSSQIVRAPMPGMLKSVLVSEGDVVQRGTPLCILEAMKMENEIKSPGDLVVKRIAVSAGIAVDKAAVLVELIAAETGEQG